MCGSCESGSSSEDCPIVTHIFEKSSYPVFLVKIKNNQAKAKKHPKITFANAEFQKFYSDAKEQCNIERWASELIAQERVSETVIPTLLEYAGRSWIWMALCNIIVFQSPCASRNGYQEHEVSNHPPELETPKYPAMERKHLSFAESTDPGGGGAKLRRRRPTRSNSGHAYASGYKHDGSSCALVNVDWTNLRSDVGHLPPFLQFFRGFDWASTPLGPISSWTSQLRQSVITALANPDPRLILWGDEMTLIYNEACVGVIGQKHPQALGSVPTELFADAWEAMSRPVHLALHKGVTTKIQNFYLAMYRSRGLEETYCKCTLFSP